MAVTAVAAIAMAAGALTGAAENARDLGRPLVFGIYPGGAAGVVRSGHRATPEEPAKRLTALMKLRPRGGPFVLHLYAKYVGPRGWTAAQQVGRQISGYARRGLETELVITYRPRDGGSPRDVGRFVAFVRQTVRQLGRQPRFVGLQITNEANITGAPKASDGAFRFAVDALIQGVIAAKQEILGRGFRQLKVGFNWADTAAPGQAAFWHYLAQLGGAAFVGSLDWVGLDAYPGTWGPRLTGSLTRGTRKLLDDTLHRLRGEFLPIAGIPPTLPLHVSETGYPTGGGRTDAMQVAAMKASVAAVNAARRVDNITDYRWFDLRDADSADRSVESQYGLMRDNYRPKAAFSVYRRLVARLSAR